MASVNVISINMTLDFLVALLYMFNGMASSVVMVKIKNQTAPGWLTFIPSMIGMVLWTVAVRKSKLPVVELSALYDVLGALAYFIGFAMYGEKITPIQWTGISLLTFSLYLINK